MIAFIDAAEDRKPVWGTVFLRQRAIHGVELICKVLPIAPSTFHDRSGDRPYRADRRFPMPIATSFVEVLRRPVESAQYVSIKYTERLAEAGIEPSVGSVGDSYDNALAETINGLYKAEVIHRRTMAVVRGRRIRHARMGRMVQPSAAARTHWQHPTRRSRGALLCDDRTIGYGRVNQTKQPPANPARFILSQRLTTTRATEPRALRSTAPMPQSAVHRLGGQEHGTSRGLAPQKLRGARPLQ